MWLANPSIKPLSLKWPWKNVPLFFNLRKAFFGHIWPLSRTDLEPAAPVTLSDWYLFHGRWLTNTWTGVIHKVESQRNKNELKPTAGGFEKNQGIFHWMFVGSKFCDVRPDTYKDFVLSQTELLPLCSYTSFHSSLQAFQEISVGLCRNLFSFSKGFLRASSLRASWDCMGTGEARK